MKGWQVCYTVLWIFDLREEYKSGKIKESGETCDSSLIDYFSAKSLDTGLNDVYDI